MFWVLEIRVWIDLYVSTTYKLIYSKIYIIYFWSCLGSIHSEIKISIYIYIVMNQYRRTLILINCNIFINIYIYTSTTMERSLQRRIILAGVDILIPNRRYLNVFLTYTWIVLSNSIQIHMHWTNLKQNTTKRKKKWGLYISGNRIKFVETS